MYIEYSKTMHFNKKIDGRTEFLPSFASYSKQKNIRIEIETNTLTIKNLTEYSTGIDKTLNE